MKKLISIITASLMLTGAGVFTSCDLLDQSPIDAVTSGNFWQTEEQVDSFVISMHQMLRGTYTGMHIHTLGELRGGHYIINSAGIDGTAMNDINYINQDITFQSPGVNNFGSYMGLVANCNEGIERVNEIGWISDQQRAAVCGVLYGMRAFAYYDMYRTWGKVVIRLTPEVVNGNITPADLYKARSECADVVAQIDSDIKASLSNFANSGNYKSYLTGGAAGVAANYWTADATKALAADFYLWISKVSCGNWTANDSYISTAKGYLKELEAAHPLAATFAEVFGDVSTGVLANKGTTETIFAVLGSETEYTHPFVTNYLFNSGANGLTVQTAGVSSFLEDGTHNFPDYTKHSGGQQYKTYANALFFRYDKEDSRRLATFLPCYNDQEATQLKGTFVVKNIGRVSTTSGFRAFDNDIPFYRAAWVHLALAEIANYEGDNAGVETYINNVRQRAYGANWDVNKFGYKAGSFTDNELAILHEKDKEFVQEGQRWWDVNRMTLTKGGEHLVFCNEGSVGYGLSDEILAKPEVGYSFAEDADPAQNANYTVAKTIRPLLDKATESHKVLLPLNRELMESDPELEHDQNPGY